MFTRKRDAPRDAVPFNVIDKFLCLQERRSRRSRRASDWNVGAALRGRGHPPGAEELRELVADAADRVPALGYRVAGRGRHRFFESCPVDPAFHVEELRCPAGWTVEQCLTQALERPWTEGRPPWGLQIVSGYRAGEHLLVYRVAHQLQDGLAAAATASAMLSGARLPAPQAHARSRFTIPDARALRAGMALAPRFLAPGTRWLPAGGGPARSLAIRPPVVLDRAAFDDITRATGAATAQICLAVVSGALRSLASERHGHRTGRPQRRGFPVYFTVSLQQPRDRAGLGNRVGMIPLTLPCDEPSPARRLRRIVRRTDYERLGRYRALLAGMLNWPNLAGWALAHVLAASQQRRLTVTIVPAPPGTIVPADSELIALPPRPSSQHGVLAVLVQPDAITMHPALQPSIEGADRLPALFAGALAELHTAVTPRPALQPARSTP
jgi:diacylglycerol O-acyltransferase / wax synthase